MAWSPILVRYGEIGIKSRPVRAEFERLLVDRIEEQLVRRGVEAEVTRDFGRIFVRAADTEGALDALRHTFGIVSASPATECAPTPAAVAALALEVARERLPEGGSFAMRAKRSGHHAFTSLDVAIATADRVLTDLADRRPRVDLDAPDLQLRAEVREAQAFVFTRTEKGPGGLPLGSQGRVGVFADSPRAAHAAWLVAKRGSLPVLFASDTGTAARHLAPLAPWMGAPRVHHAIERAAMGPLLQEHRCLALVVADGAAEAIARADEDAKVGFPVFRPLVGFPGARFAKLCQEAELPVVPP